MCGRSRNKVKGAFYADVLLVSCLHNCSIISSKTQRDSCGVELRRPMAHVVFRIPVRHREKMSAMGLTLHTGVPVPMPSAEQRFPKKQNRKSGG